jgi:anti-sigma factor RsiW
MSACDNRILLLHGLIDGELDAANSLAIEAHVKECAGCAEELRRLEAIKAALSAPELRPAAPTALRARIGAALALEEASAAPRTFPAPRPRAIGPWIGAGAFLAVAASLAMLIAVPQLTASGIEDQLVASHVRSLLASHLTDVATSSRHVVKPWFNGRIDFAPPVVELADQGFPLVGGRLDYIEGRVVPAIVYRRNLHSINLFVRPVESLASPVSIATRRGGYSLIRWTQGGFEYWAVSDIEPQDLEQFHQFFAARAQP